MRVLYACATPLTGNRSGDHKGQANEHHHESAQSVPTSGLRSSFVCPAVNLCRSELFDCRTVTPLSRRQYGFESRWGYSLMGQRKACPVKGNRLNSASRPVAVSWLTCFVEGGCSL